MKDIDASWNAAQSGAAHLSATLTSDGFSLPGYVLQRRSCISVSTLFLINFGYVQCNTCSNVQVIEGILNTVNLAIPHAKSAPLWTLEILRAILIIPSGQGGGGGKL